LPPSPVGGGSIAERSEGDRGGVNGGASRLRRSPRPARFARDPPPTGEGRTECADTSIPQRASGEGRNVSTAVSYWNVIISARLSVGEFGCNGLLPRLGGF